MAGYADGASERVRALRNALGLTQGEVATRIESDQSSISDWEKGRRQPRPRQLRALAALTADPDAWFRYLREGGAPPGARRAGDPVTAIHPAQQAAYGAMYSIGEQLKAVAREGRDLRKDEVAALAVLYVMVVEPQLPGSSVPPNSSGQPVTIGEIAGDLDAAIEEARAAAAKQKSRARRGKRTG